MNILITGAYGFLGRNTAKKFKNVGHVVVGMGHGKWDKDEYSQWGLDDWYETTITFEALLSLNKTFDLIVHCGGSGSVGFSYENPYEDFKKSVQSTLDILEYIRLQNPDCKFIYPSSPAVQGNLGNIRIKEEMAAAPISPYGFHKKIAEELCLSYHKNYNIQVGIIRFFSIYGNGLQKQLLWDACKKIQNSDKVTFFGTGKETRDWIHISDATSLIECVAKNLTDFHLINGGSGESTSIETIIRQLCKYFQKPVEVCFNCQVKEGDPTHFWADNTKALALGWKPTMKIEDGLADYVGYYHSLAR
ncbi:MAG: SDR family oxidoreductase [Flavobacteriaceae bacterium]|nr:SDR family oxidoreductase [Flavobacteriaceae bacterium]